MIIESDKTYCFIHEDRVHQIFTTKEYPGFEGIDTSTIKGTVVVELTDPTAVVGSRFINGSFFTALPSVVPIPEEVKQKLRLSKLLDELDKIPVLAGIKNRIDNGL